MLALACHAATGEPRETLLAEGDSALRRRDLDAAAVLFERAGFIRHAADAELGLIRTYMQAGEYRRALAFAAHTAGAHPDSAPGSAMYARLLQVGGHVQVAARLLERARDRLPRDADLLSDASLSRLGPYGEALPPDVYPVASGLLFDGGSRALVPAHAAAHAGRTWLRDGLGRVSAATPVRMLDDLGLAELQLDTPLNGKRLALAPRDPFPGSPAFAVAFAEAEVAAPAWPQLYAGFLGQAALGVDMPAALPGGVVFDHAGRLTGLALNKRFVPVRLLKLSDPAMDGARTSVEEIYETALAATVQVMTYGGRGLRDRPQ